MNKKMSIVALSAAFIGMGVAMPQCPGEKAMQQQVDTLQASNVDMTRKLSMLDSQVKQVNQDLGQTRQLLTQLASAVTAQKDAMDRMDAAVKDIQTKMAAAAAPKAKAPAKGKKKGK
jgi:hypothetical protein